MSVETLSTSQEEVGKQSFPAVCRSLVVLLFVYSVYAHMQKPNSIRSNFQNIVEIGLSDKEISDEQIKSSIDEEIDKLKKIHKEQRTKDQQKLLKILFKIRSKRKLSFEEKSWISMRFAWLLGQGVPRCLLHVLLQGTKAVLLEQARQKFSHSNSDNIGVMFVFKKTMDSYKTPLDAYNDMSDIIVSSNIDRMVASIDSFSNLGQSVLLLTIERSTSSHRVFVIDEFEGIAYTRNPWTRSFVREMSQVLFTSDNLSDDMTIQDFVDNDDVDGFTVYLKVSQVVNICVIPYEEVINAIGNFFRPPVDAIPETIFPEYDERDQKEPDFSGERYGNRN